MLRLALPVVAGELGWMAMGAVDTVMVGHLGPEAIGAVGLGRTLFLGFQVVGVGLLLGLDTVVAHAHGARDADEGRRWLLHGVYLSVALAIPLTVLVRLGPGLLARWGIAQEVLALTRPYLLAVSWSVLPLLLFTAFRRYLQAVDRVVPVMVALVSANLINVVGNGMLIRGWFGFPAMGVAGAAWATCAASLYMALVLGGAIVYGLPARSRAPLALRPERARVLRLSMLGAPAAGQLVLEIGVFAAATLLAAWLDATSLAAHQIALIACSLTYMVPLGVSSAAAVRVGQALGREEPAAAKAAGWAAFAVGVGFMGVAALAFVLAPRALVGLFSHDDAVLTLGARLLAVAALFQLFDGLQVVGTGALRGTGDTRTPLLWNLIGHWLLGLPAGYWLCFHRGWGVVGLWIGWLIGLGTVGCVLLLVWSRRGRSPRRGVVD